MRIILVRHGQAVEREDFLKEKKDDALRPLVNKGKKRSLQLAEALHSWVGGVDLLVTSPYLRAKQTAEILSYELHPQRMVEVMELIPSAPPMAFSQWLRGNVGLATTVVVVGHEPQLSSFATWTLSGQMQSFIDLKKSGAIAIEIENLQEVKPGHGQLSFLISPKMLD